MSNSDIFDMITEYSNRIEYSNENGELHREDGPAVIYNGGQTEWYKDGKLHREGGPAMENPGYIAKWYKDGELHREDGPAVVYSNTIKVNYWYRNGIRHRVDGPAVEYGDNGGEYWVNGIKYHTEDFRFISFCAKRQR